MANSPSSSRIGLILGAAMIVIGLVLFASDVVGSAVTFPLMGAGLGTLLFGLYHDHNTRKR
jgi:phosphate/sulfate permease